MNKGDEVKNVQNVLILGGYGNVGSMIATSLVERSDIHVIIAGRRAAQAEKLAGELGDRATARIIDVTAIQSYSAALENVQMAVVCFDLPDDSFPRACLERRINYVDISAEPEVLSRIEALDDIAKKHDATAIISVGLMPGISNLMAKGGVEQLEDAQRVDNVALLGLGEAFGFASADWTLSHYGDRYDENRICVDMGNSFGLRTAYRFAFADQYVIPKTLPVHEAASWGCYDRVLSTHVIGLVRFLRLGWLFRNPTLRRWLISAILKPHFGSDVFVVTSRVTGEQPNQQYQSWIRGKGEAEITAHVAAETGNQLLTGAMPHGVHHLEELFDLDNFLPLLYRHGITFEEIWQPAQ